MTTVTLEGVGKRFGGLRVIEGVDLEVGSGEFVALVGPSGCGKSTLLRLISGLDVPTEGTIRIGGEDVTDVAPKDRDIAMVFQSYALYPHMTAAENMGFSLRLRRAPPPEIGARVGDAATILNLSDYLERRPKELSGGQRQRVAMGRAIVRDPKVFLFDEPLSNLDAKLRVQMRAEIKALHARLGATTIYVTHDQIEAMTMGDRIVVMQGGRVEQAGAPLDLYDAPRNRFVAGFIGSPAMNFLSATVAASGGALDVGGAGSIPLPGGASLAPGARVTAGLRPEHLLVGPPGAGLSARVEVVEPTGAETHVALRVGGAPVLAVVRDRVALAPGAAVSLTAEPRHLHVFGEDGAALLPRRPEAPRDVLGAFA